MISRFHRFAGVVVLALLFFTVSCGGAASAPTVPDITKVPAAAQPSDHFDVNAATDAYMDLMPASAKARSDAYFEGGYWLILWDFPARRGDCAVAAEPGLVSVDAQPGRAHHEMEVAANLHLLG